MKLRFEIIASDNTPTGTMFLTDKISAKKGEVFLLELDVNTDHIAPGSYRFDLLAFEHNDFGVQDWCDRVEGAPLLDIVKRKADDLEWLPQHWGHTQLESIHLISSNIE